MITTATSVGSLLKWASVTLNPELRFVMSYLCKDEVMVRMQYLFH